VVCLAAVKFRSNRLVVNISVFYPFLVSSIGGEGEMTTSLEPADTRMMGIVHAALRRDLLRTRSALTAWGWKGTGCWTGSTRRATRWCPMPSRRCRGSSCCTASRLPARAGPGQPSAHGGTAPPDVSAKNQAIPQGGHGAQDHGRSRRGSAIERADDVGRPGGPVPVLRTVAYHLPGCARRGRCAGGDALRRLHHSGPRPPARPAAARRARDGRLPRLGGRCSPACSCSTRRTTPGCAGW